jgi:cephalosporin hydroxylase
MPLVEKETPPAAVVEADKPIGGKTVLGDPVERYEPPNGMTKQQIIDEYHKLTYSAAYEENLTWQRTQWLGFPIFKMPQDLITLTDIIWQTKPQLIIESGTAAGGSALFMASYCDAMNFGKILSIDLRPVDRNYPAHPRITFLGGHSSVDEGVLREVQSYVDFYKGPIMVILDSDHAAAHVAKELEAYCGFVTPGSYLVVEDVNVNNHPVLAEHGPGPYEAMHEFLPRHPEFKEDLKVARWQLFSQHGWLRRIRG